MRFPKPAKTVREQIAILKSRNMLFADEAMAEKFLQNVSYYRLGLYWFDLRLKTDPNSKEYNKRQEQFAAGTYFEEVIRRYQFDAQLRLLILQALEKIENSLKAKWSNFFSYKYKNPLFYTDPAYYDERRIKGKAIKETIKRLEECFADSKNEAIIKCRSKIPANELPEAWIITEICDFGTFLYLVSFMNKRDKQELAHFYAMNSETDFLKNGEFIRVLAQIRLIRNICAHHGRLWNRSFVGVLPLPLSPLLKEA